MKKLVLTILFGSLLSFFSSSCTKDNSSNNNNNSTGANSFAAVAGNVYYVVGNLSVTNSNGTLTIIATSSGSNDYISLSIPTASVPGTYSLNNSNAVYNVLTFQPPNSYVNKPINVTSGAIVISSNSGNVMQATFYFSGNFQDPSNTSVSVTNGSFSASY